MALTNFTPAAYGALGATKDASVAQAVPGGGGATLLITNLGPSPAVVLLGASAVVVTLATGVAVLPNQSIALAVGANTHIAAIGAGGTAVLNLAQGA